MKGVVMKTSTKLIATGAASVLGIALAVGGAQASSGPLTVRDTPGHVVQVSGVVPVSANASPSTTAHVNPNAKGLSRATVAQPAARATVAQPAARATVAHPAAHATPHATPHATTHATPHATTHATVHQVARPAAQHLPAHHEGTSTCGTDHGSTGMSGSESHMR
jgi:hypothetical protein